MQLSFLSGYIGHFKKMKLSFCPHCFCMTKTIKGKCGKCREERKMKSISFEGEVLKGRNGYEVVNEVGNSLDKILEQFKNKKVFIIVEDVE